LENKLVAHRKIHFLELTKIKKHVAELYMIYLRFTKVTTSEIAINKRQIMKIARAKIAFNKCASLEFLMI
jgi:hypothetical protein